MIVEKNPKKITKKLKNKLRQKGNKVKPKKKTKYKPPIKFSKAEADEMSEIITANGALLRAMFALDPYENIQAAGHFYSGVAAGIGITLKWRAKEKPPTTAGGSSPRVPK